VSQQLAEPRPSERLRSFLIECDLDTENLSEFKKILAELKRILADLGVDHEPDEPGEQDESPEEPEEDNEPGEPEEDESSWLNTAPGPGPKYELEETWAKRKNITRRTVARYRDEPDGLPYLRWGGRIWIHTRLGEDFIRRRITNPNRRRRRIRKIGGTARPTKQQQNAEMTRPSQRKIFPAAARKPKPSSILQKVMDSSG
jgi:hypothetical protein